MSGSTVLVGALRGGPSPIALQEISKVAGILQVNAEPSLTLSAAWLREHFSGELLYALPPTSQLGIAQRHQALIKAARTYDLVQLDSDCDLAPDVLAAIPPRQRLVCWRGAGNGIAALRAAFARISVVPARFRVLITQSTRSVDGVFPLSFLKELRSNEVTAICEGKAASWSRILAPHFGSPLLFGKVDPTPVDDSGELSLKQLVGDYGFPRIHRVHEVYGIVGNRVFQSPSPRLHNAGYRALGHPALFLPFYAENFETFWQEMIESSVLEDLGLSVKGFTIVSPYKEAAFATVPLHSAMAARAAASNIFIRRDGDWEAHTTDPDSVAGVTDNCQRLPFKAAVIGCGGAGRAIAAALEYAGAQVTLVNRGQDRGELAVKLLGLPFVPLRQFRAAGYSLLVNATPVGRDDDSLPFEIDSLSRDAVVIDLVYGTRPTPLVTGVAALGATAIDGYDVLLNQVRKQFQLMTGHEMPATVSRGTAAAHAIGNSACSVKDLHRVLTPGFAGQVAN